MADASQPVDDDFRKVMTITGVDETTAKKVLEESGGNMALTINRLLDMEVDVGIAQVVNHKMLSMILQQVIDFVSGQQLP